MWKNSKAFIRNIIIYFIPFIIMAMVAMFFLHHSFTMLQEQNMSIMKAQLQNVLDDVEDNLSYSMDIAKDMCIDSALRRKNMLVNDANTVAAISKILSYKSRMSMCNTLFINYELDRIITDDGICDLDIFLGDQLQLSEDGKATFYNLRDSEATFSSGVLQRTNSENYLMFLYYYPESSHIEEQRIGFLIDVRKFNAELKQILSETNSLVVVRMNNEQVTVVNCLSEHIEEERLNRMLATLEKEEEIAGFSIINVEGKRLNMSMQVAVNSGELRAELIREEVKMALIGIVVFITMSVFLYVYSKYHYQLISEIKQFAISYHPEFKSNAGESEYSIIRKVLEQDLEKLKRKDEDFSLFKKEAKKQLTWLLLSTTLPNDLDLEAFLENYDIAEGGPYYCVLEFWVEDSITATDIEAIELNQAVFLQYTTHTEGGILYIVGVSLNSRDDAYEERNIIIEKILNELSTNGYYCSRVASGLVYNSIREIHSSQQEAFTLLQDPALWKQDKKVLFFDERTHMTKRVPHITADLLETLREKLLNNETAEACEVLKLLMAPPKNIAEDLNIYVRYKVISILMEVANEKGISDIQDMIHLSNLESDNFEAELSDVIKRSFKHTREKSVEIAEILAFIDANYSNTQISQEMLAEHLQSNVRTIRRIMKREINKTYKEYLNELRVNKACALLGETDWTVQQISKAVGCYEVASFYRMFKQMMEMTPDEYRNGKRIV